MSKRRLPPEDRDGSIEWENEQRIAYGFPGRPRSFEVYQKEPRKLLYRYDDTYGIFFKCKSCRSPQALLWRDYFPYFEHERQSGETSLYYKVLCVDGGPLLRLAKAGERIEGHVSCVWRIEGGIPSDTYFGG